MHMDVVYVAKHILCVKTVLKNALSVELQVQDGYLEKTLLFVHHVMVQGRRLNIILVYMALIQATATAHMDIHHNMIKHVKV